MSVKQFDPLNIAALWDAIRRTSSLRLLVMLPSSKYPARLYAYALRQPDAEIEYSTKENGGVVVGRAGGGDWRGSS